MARAQKNTQPVSRLSTQVSTALREECAVRLRRAGLYSLVRAVYLRSVGSELQPGDQLRRDQERYRSARAHVSGLLFDFFGRPAYLFTRHGLLPRLDVVPRTENSTAVHEDGLRAARRRLCATLITSCALSTLHFSPEGFNETAGGILGQVVGEWLESVMKLLGASTLLFVIWVASLSLFLGISWFSVMDRIGRWCLVGYEKARFKIGELQDKAEGRRSWPPARTVIETEKKRTAGRSKPRIEPVMPALEPSERAENERQVPLFDPPAAGELPPLSILDDPPDQQLGLLGGVAGSDVPPGRAKAQGLWRRRRGAIGLAGAGHYPLSSSTRHPASKSAR